MKKLIHGESEYLHVCSHGPQIEERERERENVFLRSVTIVRNEKIRE